MDDEGSFPPTKKTKLCITQPDDNSLDENTASSAVVENEPLPMGEAKKHSRKGGSSVIEVPLALRALIRKNDEACAEPDENELLGDHLGVLSADVSGLCDSAQPSLKVDGSMVQRSSVTEAVAAIRKRALQELHSYLRVVCIRTGLA